MIDIRDYISETCTGLIEYLGSDVVFIADERPGRTIYENDNKLVGSFVGGVIDQDGALIPLSNIYGGIGYHTVQFGITEDGCAYAWAKINTQKIEGEIFRTYAQFQLTTEQYNDLFNRASKAKAGWNELEV